MITDKNIFFEKLTIFQKNLKFIFFNGDYWEVTNNKIINNRRKCMQWDNFYSAYTFLNCRIQKSIENQLNLGLKFKNENSINTITKIIVGLSKKYNFYRNLKKVLTPYQINKSIQTEIILWAGIINMYRKPPELFSEIISIGLLSKLNPNLNHCNIRYEFNYSIYLLMKNGIITYLKNNDIYEIFLNFIKKEYYLNDIDGYARFICKKGSILSLLYTVNLGKNKEEQEYWKNLHIKYVDFMIDKLITPL